MCSAPPDTWVTGAAEEPGRVKSNKKPNNDRFMRFAIIKSSVLVFVEGVEVVPARKILK